jgi:hypothetical protein
MDLDVGARRRREAAAMASERVQWTTLAFIERTRAGGF